MSRHNGAGKRPPSVVYRGSGFYVGLVLILVIGALILVFAIQNTAEVSLEFLGLEFSVPVFAVALGAALVAIVLDELVGLVWRRRRRTRLAERSELRRLRAEAEATRAFSQAPSQGPPVEAPASAAETEEPASETEEPLGREEPTPAPSGDGDSDGDSLRPPAPVGEERVEREAR